MNDQNSGLDFRDLMLGYPQVPDLKLVACKVFSAVPDSSDSNYPNITIGALGNGATARFFIRSGNDSGTAVWQELGVTAGGVATVAEGGTGLATLTDHAVLIGAGTDPVEFAGPAAAGTILQGAGAAANPAFSTATYPSTTTINQLLYSSAANTVGGLATANNGTLVTSATGVPSILAGPVTTGNVLQSNAAAAPSFSTATYPSVATGAGTFLRADGTNWLASTATVPATAAQGDLLYASAANVWSSLAKNATQGMVLTNNGTLSAPVWSPAPGGIAEGWSNLGIALNAGVLSLVDEVGAAISATSPALVKFNSKTTPGTIKTIVLTSAPVGLTEANLTSATFGTTAAIAWADAMPFFIYAVLNSSAGVSPETAVSFFCSRNPCAQVTPATVYKPSTVASVTSQADFFGFDDAVTSADYASSPCVRVGSFRMVKSGGDAWTVQTLGSGTGGIGDGIGNYNENTYWQFPVNQNGADALSFFSTAGTSPQFSTGSYAYQLGNDGSVDVLMSFTTVSVDGAGGQKIFFHIPLNNVESNISAPPGQLIWKLKAGDTYVVNTCIRPNSGNADRYSMYNTGSTIAVVNTDFVTATIENIACDITYQAFTGN